MFKESARNRFAMLVGVVFCTMFAMLLFVLPPTSAYADAESETYEVTVEGTYHQTEARSMLAMVNKFRTAKVNHDDGNTPWYKAEDGSYVDVEGLSELKWDYGLEKVAMQRAVEASYLPDHSRPNGISSNYLYIENYKIDGYGHYGENYASGQNTASRAFESWREDKDDYDGQGHRRAMLEGKDIGFSELPCVGIACFEVDSVKTWIMVFGVETNCESTTPNNSKQSVSFPVDLSNLYANQLNISIVKGSTLPLVSEFWDIDLFGGFGGKLTYKLSSGLAKSIKWTISNESVADIEDGIIVAKNPGTVTLSALGCSLEINLKVTAKQTPALSGVPTSASINLSAKTYKLSPTCDSDAKPNFKSSDTTVATVDNSGSVAFKKSGTVTITVVYAETDEYEATSASCRLTVADGSSTSWTKDPDKANSWFAPDGTQVIVTPAAKVSNPAKTSISKLSKAKKSFTVKWKKKSGVTGYQIRYSLKSSMKSSKTVTVKSAKTVSKKVKKLKKKKKYYVQVRTYKVVNGKTYWSGWSAKKSVKTK